MRNQCKTGPCVESSHGAHFSDKPQFRDFSLQTNTAAATPKTNHQIHHDFVWQQLQGSKRVQQACWRWAPWPQAKQCPCLAQHLLRDAEEPAAHRWLDLAMQEPGWKGVTWPQVEQSWERHIYCRAATLRADSGREPGAAAAGAADSVGAYCRGSLRLSGGGHGGSEALRMRSAIQNFADTVKSCRKGLTQCGPLEGG